MATKERAPIYTADGKPVEVGMVVYGFDTGCRIKSEATQYITKLIVSEVDLTARRMVRLRKPDGREWKWYAEESRTACSNDDHLIYASLGKAKQAALPRVKMLIENEASEAIKDGKRGIDREKRDLERARKDLEKAEQEHRKAEARARSLRESLKVFRNLKAEDLEKPAA